MEPLTLTGYPADRQTCRRVNWQLKKNCLKLSLSVAIVLILPVLTFVLVTVPLIVLIVPVPLIVLIIPVPLIIFIVPVTILVHKISPFNILYCYYSLKFKNNIPAMCIIIWKQANRRQS